MRQYLALKKERDEREWRREVEDQRVAALSGRKIPKTRRRSGGEIRRFDLGYMLKRKDRIKRTRGGGPGGGIPELWAVL